METTPNDLRQQQFEIKFRGYNADDVEVFRDLAATALEESRAEALKLTEENKHLKQRLEHLLSLEETLKAAVIEAQRNAENTVATAKREAESIVGAAKRDAELIHREARQRSDDIMTEMHRQMSKLVTDINKIRFIRANYLSKLRNLISAQTDLIEETLAEDAEDEPKSERTQRRAPRENSGAPAPPLPREETDSELQEKLHLHDYEGKPDDTGDQIIAPDPDDAGAVHPNHLQDNRGNDNRDEETWKKLRQHLSEE